MRRRVTLQVHAPPEVVAAAARDCLQLDEQGDGPLPGDVHGRLAVHVQPGADGTTIDLDGSSDLYVPFFQWFFGPVNRYALKRGLKHASRTLEATVVGAPVPSPLKPSPVSPPAAFTEGQINFLATAALAAAIAAFGAALFGQNADAVATTFGVSDARLGTALAITRVGVLFALVATVLADRIGRRRIIIWSVAAVCIANGLSGLAPGFMVFTGAQLLMRAAVNSAVVIGGIAVVEEAPDGARAWALAMLGLAGGVGYALSVVLLPVSDLGQEAWRVAFGVSALSILLVPLIRRRLPETRRFQAVAVEGGKAPLRMREVFDRSYGPRFFLLAGVGFLTNIFSAPSAQLTNRFLSDEHGFSSSGIALFRGVTNGLPGLIGILLAGRLAETRGRRPVAVVSLFFGTLLSVAFFLGSGWVLWVTSTLGIIAAASSTLAVGTMDAELFPTEVRGTSNGLMLVAYVAGSAVGLVLAGVLSDPLGGLGRAIALCGIAPLAAAIFLLPRLPEGAHKALEDVSPSEPL